LVPNYDDRIRKTGRAVIMDAYGGAIGIEHQDFNLEFPGLSICYPNGNPRRTLGNSIVAFHSAETYPK
jgi:hypothetical protein